MRTVQAASVVAVPIGIIAAIRVRAVPALSSVMSTMRTAAGFGLLVGPVMTMGKFSQEGFNDDLIEDRAMRIAHNEGQQRWDRACLVATASVGLPLFIMTGSVLGPVGAGFALGSVGLAIETAGGPSVESLALAPYALAYNLVLLPGRALVWAPANREPVTIDETESGAESAGEAGAVGVAGDASPPSDAGERS